MKILIIGATGHIGKVAAAALESRGHDVLRASRTLDLKVDATDSESIRHLFKTVGPVDAVIVALGSVPFRHLSELTRDDYISGFMSKTLAQIEVTRHALDVVTEGGSITLTSGVLAREPITHGAAAAMANGALESFVLNAAAETPRGIRVNVVSPNVLENATSYHPLFAGQPHVSGAEVARAYVLAVEGNVTGRTIKLS